MTPVSEIHNLDCMEYMKTVPDKWFNLCICDPPYGLPKDSSHGRGKLKHRIFNVMDITVWDLAPTQEYFNELFRISKNQIIWGGNYFDLPPTRGIVCWDKVQPFENFSQIEYAWTSFSVPAKLFRFDNRTKEKIHPTQKPVELYHYLLKTFAKQGDKIFDSHLGSGSSRIAAYRLEFDFYATEIDKQYFDNQEKRFRKECFGEVRLSDNAVVKQLSMEI